jgi:endonuclease/exonuclease/phosphatase family metal-dependent hydrolase
MRLRVLNLNVWGLPLGLTRHHDARMHAIGEEFAGSGAHVISLQEVWTPSARKILAAAGRRAGYTAIWHREAAFGGSGLMVLSRLPVNRRHFTLFRLAGLPQRPQQADFYGGKGFVSLELATDQGPVTFIDTHLQAGYNAPGSPDENLGIRVGQAIQLAAHVRKLSTPVVAAGDFNSEEGESAYKILGGIGDLSDLAVALDRREPTCLTAHPYRGEDARESRIDLILSRSGRQTELRPLSLERTYDRGLEFDGEPGTYSDHAGLVADLELVPRPAAGPPRAWPPPTPAALAHAESELRAGEEAARVRRRRELSQSGALLGAGLILGGGGWRVREQRRSFLARLALGIGGIGFLGGLAGGVGSQWATANELAGFAEVRKILAGLHTARDEPVRLRTP